MMFVPVSRPVLMMSGLSGASASVTSRVISIWNERPKPPSTSSRFRHGTSSVRIVSAAKSIVHRV